jgi:hypothetical protein
MPKAPESVAVEGVHSRERVQPPLENWARSGSFEPRTTAERVATGAASVAKVTLESAADQAVQRGRDVAENQKRALADQIHVIARGLRAIGNELAKDMPGAAGFVEEGASRLDEVSMALREKQLGDLAGEAARLGREHPILLFGAAALIGLAASRFLKAAPESAHVQP